MRISAVILALWNTFAVTACVNTSQTPQQAGYQSAEECLKQAGEKKTPVDQRAVLYLRAAAESGSNSARGTEPVTYNQAAAGLTVLLRSADSGRMWNHPLTLTSGTTIWRLRFSKGTRDGVWNPDYFTSFTPAGEVRNKTIKHPNRQVGIGGALVGVRKTSPVEPFSPSVGVAAPVTATLDFKGRDVTLTLFDPGKKPQARVAGTERVLEADFTAPLAYYPQRSEFWNGLMGAIHVNAYMGTTGLYMLEPYDPDRIPLIFVHGLISTPQMWRNVINELENDPRLRGRYQCWVFGYPTGNTPWYSALRFRQELEKLHQLHPDAKPYVLVGHSMGGLISHMEATTVTRQSWDALGKEKARKFFASVIRGSFVEQALIFHANPHIGRLIFICTPHRGSKMALGKLGELAQRLIFLPVEITSNVTNSLVDGNALESITGESHRMPNSVSGLAPTSPMYRILELLPIEVTHHSIIGDQGKGDTPNSSDGVVEYWSSHLKTTQSECIVPGPHGSCELPETITELRRVLHHHSEDQRTDPRKPRAVP